MTSRLDVTTADGVVRGRRLGDLLTWRGIPFAAAPVGPLRLRAPQPVEPWTGVRDATEFGAAAPQPRMGTALRPGKYQPISEDCLTLNVVAPATASTKPRPVMVFVHGGAFVIGTTAMGLYRGDRLVRRGDIVYVSVNYRLGALGFLDFREFSTADRPFDANLGLRDQVAALEWVQRNIAAFGGDPGNVTVFGESAGGTSVTTLMATPTAQGLFARAIAESAAPVLVNEAQRARESARQFLDLLGADRGEASRALDLATPAELGRAARRLSAKTLADTPGLHPFGPVVDGDFLPTAPLQAFTDGTAHPMPMIIGTNAREGALFPRLMDGLPTDAARIDAMFALTDPDARERILAAYPGYPAPAAAIALGGDLTFWKPSIDIADAHSAHAATYSYRFDYAPRLMHWLGLGATHALEMIAVFGYGDSAVGRALTAPGGRSGLRAVTDRMQENWIAFARNGVPEPWWPRYDAQHRRTLIFDAPARVERDPGRDRRLAWADYRGYVGEGAADRESDR
ncbi:carboxylesterase/lipase family protein [Rhodococcus sp. SGAir0479]|uniref:carboxylesterase/lipase family protein n=1 Tax=Rhodococcus sp. SGAir0479 TaxID=2567884 RepID=UPI0010CCC923|nr:carboxylesterase/lipase family protein [Rhodococcus sp. SGAir0479]QCQ90031.1 carboxylesterase/lipase family protein [Rhodococcus sp. SGAir0479]